MNNTIKEVFDRDGVLIDNMGYILDPDDTRQLEGATEALTKVAAQGYHRFIVTNQSGVARGYFGELAIGRGCSAIQAMLTTAKLLDDLVYYPHHPGSGVWRSYIVCACRKPHMIDTHGVDRSDNFSISGKPTYLQMASRTETQARCFPGRRGASVAVILSVR